MKKKTIRILSVLFLMLVFTQIFFFSNQNGEESENLSLNLMRKITILLSKNNEISQKNIDQIIYNWHVIIREFSHFIVFVPIGIFVMCLISTYKIKLRYKFLISMSVGILYAVFDELHQFFVQGRAAELMDVGIDTLGVLFGVFFAFLIIKK